MIAPPNTAPFQPPNALPNTPAAPPGKKSIIIGGTMAAHPIAPNISIHIIKIAVADINPIITAVGAYGKITGQSSAGLAPGMILVEIPLNAGTISPKNIRTPNSKTVIPAANLKPCNRAHTTKLRSPACSATKVLSAKSADTTITIPITTAVLTVISLKKDILEGILTVSEPSSGLPTKRPNKAAKYPAAEDVCPYPKSLLLVTFLSILSMYQG